jgi:hypothetical protein
MASTNLNRKSIGAISFVAVVMISCAGCHLRPNWGPPGTIQDQRNRAVLYDPFPSNELAPEIQGGRPLEYQQPRSQAFHLQQNPFARRANQGAPFIQPNGF